MTLFTQNKYPDTIKLIALGFITVLAILVISSCSSSTGESPLDPDSNWLVPIEQVVDGGPGKDGIPSVDQPKFSGVNAEDTGYLQDERLVLVLKVKNETRIYPHQILDWHEIVNDEFDDTPVAVTYCPLTGTGITIDRRVNGTVTEFGVSGLLFKNNLIPYDRNTESHWSQMQIRGIEGDLAGEKLRTYAIVETTWGLAKEIFPDAQVMTTETGYGRSYTQYAYGQSYLTDHDDILFPVDNEDDRLPNKTRVHGVITSEFTGEGASVRVYPLNPEADSITVLNDDFKEHALVFAANYKNGLGVSFFRHLENEESIREFEAVQDSLPIIMKDRNGNYFDLFGEIISGPETGKRLQQTTSYSGYWFSFADMYPGNCIYPNSSRCTSDIDK